MTTSTADILDEYPERAAVCTLALRQFGGVRAFQGPISTVRCHEDNVLLKQRVAEPGDGYRTSPRSAAQMPFR